MYAHSEKGGDADISILLEVVHNTLVMAIPRSLLLWILAGHNANKSKQETLGQNNIFNLVTDNLPN